MRTVYTKATIISAILSALIFVPMFFMSEGAPQQAAAAAMGVFCIFTPYAIARILQSEDALANQEKIIKLLESTKKGSR